MRPGLAIFRTTVLGDLAARAAVAALAALALTLTACSAAPRGASEAAWREYLQALERLEGRPTVAPGSDEARQAVARLQSLLSDYTRPEFQERIRDVYAEEVFFNDTLKTLHGVDAVAEHFATTASALDRGTVEFVDVVTDEGDYYLRWVMRMRFKRLADGEETLSVGMSHIRFDADGRVVLHQDFWDSAGGLFEHVPVVGWALRRAKGRL